MSVTLSPPRLPEQRLEDRRWSVEEFHRAAATGDYEAWTPEA